MFSCWGGFLSEIVPVSARLLDGLTRGNHSMGIDFYYWSRMWDLLQALPYWEQATFPKGMCASSVCQGELMASFSATQFA